MISSYLLLFISYRNNILSHPFEGYPSPAITLQSSSRFSQSARLLFAPQIPSCLSLEELGCAVLGEQSAHGHGARPGPAPECRAAQRDLPSAHKVVAQHYINVNTGLAWAPALLPDILLLLEKCRQFSSFSLTF